MFDPAGVAAAGGIAQFYHTSTPLGSMGFVDTCFLSYFDPAGVGGFVDACFLSYFDPDGVGGFGGAYYHTTDGALHTSILLMLRVFCISSILACLG